MIRIKDDISVYNGVSRIQRKIDRIPKENETEVKDGNVFLYFEQKAQLIPLEIKGGKIYILPLEPKLADFSVVPPANTNINPSKDLSSEIKKIPKKNLKFRLLNSLMVLLMALRIGKRSISTLIFLLQKQLHTNILMFGTNISGKQPRNFGKKERLFSKKLNFGTK